MLVKPKARNSLMLSCTSSSVVKSGICGTLMVTLSGDNNRLAHSRCCSTADLTPVYLQLKSGADFYQPLNEKSDVTR